MLDALRAVAALIGAPAVATLNPRGPGARDPEQLWWLMFWLGVATFAIFLAVMVRASFRGERDVAPANEGKPGVPPRDAATGRLHPMIPWGGVVLPAVVIGVVFVAAMWAMRTMPIGSAAIYGTADAAEEAGEGLVIEVTGRQWWWEAHYPAAGVTTAGEIHIPVDTRVEIRLSSGDVVHSFWVPRLAGKMDALPDHGTRLWIEADEPGTYPGRCAEFCGLQHAHMEFTVIAEPADDFDGWLLAQGADAAAPQGEVAQRGEEVFLEANCTSCHTVRGGAAGAGSPDPDTAAPDLTHLASRERIIANALPNTAESLERWLTDPQHVKSGTQMEPVDLPPEDLRALLAYLEGLE